MKRFRGLCLGLVGLLGIANSPAHASGFPLVLNTMVNSSSGTLTINGQNFGSAPVVTLNASSFPIAQSGTTQIVVNFPTDKPLSMFAPGTYLLTLAFKNQLPSIFTVVIGANGAQGPAGSIGPQGVAGLQGIQGLPGANGAPGAMGPPGPMGATGAAGAQGPAGVVGAVGQTGATGAQGPQGLQGTTGSNGTNGTGAPVCTSTDTVVSYRGSLACKSTLPRYVDNGDGTVTDNLTGLMWEKKVDPSVPVICHIGDSSCPPAPVHDVNNLYSWSFTPPLADGILFTAFIPGLNGGDFYYPSAGQVISGGAQTCFANHCDWRIPTVAELKMIIEPDAPGCGSGSPCIDPAFGPSQASCYWSSSSMANDANGAWDIHFGDGLGLACTGNKINAVYARAVRSGR